MKNDRSGYYGHRFAPEIISYAVWVYHRFCLSFRDVADLLAERGIVVSYETIRLWCQKFGPDYARKLKRRMPRCHQMSGHGARLGRKREEAIATLVPSVLNKHVNTAWMTSVVDDYRRSFDGFKLIHHRMPRCTQMSSGVRTRRKLKHLGILEGQLLPLPDTI